MFENDVSVGNGFTCAINASNEIWCAGRNNLGQLGIGAAGADQNTPVREATMASNWSVLNVEQNHACAINTLGELYCWGEGTNGKLGDGASAQRDLPTRIGVATDWIYLGMNNFGSCGIRGSGVLYCWGRNAQGQVGNGTSGADETTPQLVSGGYSDWTMVKGNNTHFCGLRASGQAYCWGDGGSGKVKANGTTGSSNVPFEITGNFTDWTYIVAGFNSSCGIRGGRMYCWGARINYGIPDGGAIGGGNQLTMVEAAGGFTDWAMVAPPANQGGCAARANGSIYCWGENGYGQVGDGTTDATTIPVKVQGLNGCH